MAVNGDHIPFESPEFLIDGIRRHNLLNGSVDLKIVVIHKYSQVVQSVVAGGHGRLPDLSLLDLPVAQRGIHTVVLLVYFSCKRHADSRGKSLSQGSGRHIHTRDLGHLHMSGQIAVYISKCLQILHREISLQRQCGVHGGRTVSFGQHEPVPIRIFWILRVNVHFLKIQYSQDICH